MSTQQEYTTGLPKNLKNGETYLLRIKSNTYKTFRHVKATYTNKGFVAKEGFVVNPSKILGYYK